jgi:hypothetical protein
MINLFRGENYFLSNMYPVNILFNGITFKSSEHLYQAHKAIYLIDFENIVNCEKGVETKKIAKEMQRNKRIRKDFHEIKDHVMTVAVLLKFGQNKDIKEKLLATGIEMLIEGNYWHDNYWGNCTCDKCKHILGVNRLGKTLMSIRTILSFQQNLLTKS